MLGDLSAKYESNGRTDAISSGEHDQGGKSYGVYQLSSEVGTVRRFLTVLLEGKLPMPGDCLYRGRAIGRQLMTQPIGSEEFDNIWRDISCNESGIFFYIQHTFIKHDYYDQAVAFLKEAHFDINHHSRIMQDVVWSRAVQYGPNQIVQIFTEALAFMPKKYPDLSYVDDFCFDWDLIHSIYEVCKSVEWNNTDLRESLLDRFQKEQYEALMSLAVKVK